MLTFQPFYYVSHETFITPTHRHGLRQLVPVSCETFPFMNPVQRIVILANGELLQKEYVLSHLQEDDFIIAANGGTRLAYLLQRMPALVVGDSDSLPGHLQVWLKSHEVPVKKHPVEKDETDLELAIRYAITLKPKKILFLGLTGGRTDHMLANFALLGTVAAHGIAVEVIVNREHIFTVAGQFTLNGNIGETISLIPWGGTVYGITTTGLKWELQNEDLPFGSARGISNILIKSTIEITVEQGLLLVIHQRHNLQ